MNDRLHTLGKAATAVGCQTWQLSKLCERGKIPFRLAGRYRLIADVDLPAIRTALIAAGYLAEKCGAVTA